MLMCLSGTNFALNGHDEESKFGPWTVSSDNMPYYRYPVILVNRYSVAIELL